MLYLLTCLVYSRHELINITWRGIRPLSLDKIDPNLPIKVISGDFTGTEDLIFIEDSVHDDYNIKIKHWCSFQEKIKFYNVYENKEKQGDVLDAYVDKEIPGYHVLEHLLEENNHGITHDLSNASLVLMRADKKFNDDSNFAYNEKSLNFLDDAYTSYHVYARSTLYIQKFCPGIYRYQWPDEILLIIFILFNIFGYIVFNRILKQEYEQSEPLWLFHKKHKNKLLYGDINVENPDFYDKHVLIVAGLSQNIEEPLPYVVKITRQNDCFKREIIGAFPGLGDWVWIFRWEDVLPPFNELFLKCELDSDLHYTVNKPEILFSSYRDVRSYHVNFKLENNTECKIDLPPNCFSPYNQYGKFAIIILTTYHEFCKLIKKSPYQFDNFSTLATTMCRVLSVHKAVFFDINDSMIYQYSSDGYSKYSEDNVKFLIDKVKDIQGFTLVRDFAYEESYTFIFRPTESHKSLTIIIELDPKSVFDNCDSLELPFLSMCINILYKISGISEKRERYKRTCELLSLEKKTTIGEYHFDADKCYIWNPDIKEVSVIKRDDFFDYFPFDVTSKLNDVMEGKKPNYDKMLDVDGQKYRLTISKSPKNSTLDSYSVICEDVTNIVEQEKAFIDALIDLKNILSSLNVIQFKYTDQQYILDDHKLPSLLGYSDKSTYLKDYIVNSDVQLLDRVIQGQRTPIRLKDSDGNALWFNLLFSKGVGYLYLIHHMVDPNVKLKCKDIMLRNKKPGFIFWKVDPETNRVIKEFHQPTIWDLLSVDPSTKFSSFITYVCHEDRQIVEDGLDYIKKEINKKATDSEPSIWSGEVRLLIPGEGAIWFTLKFSYHQKMIKCAAININLRKLDELSAREVRELRDILLLGGQFLLWKFNDNRLPIAPFKKFDSDTIILSMNWTFIEQQVHPSFQEQLIRKLKLSLEKGKEFKMDLPLLVGDNQTWVSLRGARHDKQIIGVCIDITDKWHAYEELESKKQAAINAQKDKTLFLENMSHEIRTPMNGILGMLDVLATLSLNHEQSQIVEILRSSTTQLLLFIDNKINLSAIENNSKFDITPQVFSILNVIEPTLIANKSKARAKGITFNVSINNFFPSLVYSDPNLFLQIINNLLSNAIKFTSKGSVSLEIKWVETDSSKESCVIIVTDTGIGIDPKSRNDVFKPYVQATSDIAKIYGGTGLGLALVYELSKCLGGGVELESKLNEGCKFTVTLPMESVMFPYTPKFCDEKRHTIMFCIESENLKQSFLDWFSCKPIYNIVEFSDVNDIEELHKNTTIHLIVVESDKDDYMSLWSQLRDTIQRLKASIPICSFNDPGQSTIFRYNIMKPVLPNHIFNILNNLRYKKNETSAPAVVYQSFQIKHILIVDDEPSSQTVLKKMLEKLNCSYTVANNGQEAINYLEVDDFDLIFMDYLMPVLDGISATKIIRQSNKPYSKIPIIGLTASVSKEDQTRCIEAGMDQYINKPVRMKDICDEIRKHTNV